MNRADKAMQLFTDGYTCAQAVVLAYEDLLDADSDTLKYASAPFGGGIGRLREVCGAVSGMMMVIGCANKPDTLDRTEKLDLYSLEQKAAQMFRERAGAIVCRELLATRPHKDEHNSHKPACRLLVGLAVGIIEELEIFGDDYDK